MPLAVIFVFIRTGKPSLPPSFPSLFCSLACFLSVISSPKQGGPTSSVTGDTQGPFAGWPEGTRPAARYRDTFPSPCAPKHRAIALESEYRVCLLQRSSFLAFSFLTLLSQPAWRLKREESLHFNCGFLRWVTYRVFCKIAQETIKL